MIRNNNATAGGGITIGADCQPRIVNNIIEDNTAYYEGGGICFIGGGAGSVICGNVIARNIAGHGGGGIYCGVGSTTISNNTIVDNESQWGGGGIRVDTTSGMTYITNNILWWNESILAQSESLSVADLTHIVEEYNCIDTADGWPWGRPEGTGNVRSDPLCVDAPGGDYHLTSISPCVDAGYNGYVPAWFTTDVIDGEPRIWDGKLPVGAVVDMGADEYNNPDLVELISFTAMGFGNAVMVAWETASEIDTAGFHIWRSDKRNPEERATSCGSRDSSSQPRGAPPRVRLISMPTCS